jgi:hypothetical protein
MTEPVDFGYEYMQLRLHAGPTSSQNVHRALARLRLNAENDEY